MGTHLRVISESYLMSTNMTLGLDVFQKSLRPWASDESNLSIGMFNIFPNISFDLQVKSNENYEDISKCTYLWGVSLHAMCRHQEVDGLRNMADRAGVQTDQTRHFLHKSIRIPEPRIN